jgi:hypothetical protein
VVYASGVPRKPPARSPAQPLRHSAIVLQLEPHKYAVAVWRRDEDGEPVYEIPHERTSALKVAATLAACASLSVSSGVPRQVGLGPLGRKRRALHLPTRGGISPNPKNNLWRFDGARRRLPQAGILPTWPPPLHMASLAQYTSEDIDRRC